MLVRITTYFTSCKMFLENQTNARRYSQTKRSSKLSVRVWSALQWWLTGHHTRVVRNRTELSYKDIIYTCLFYTVKSVLQDLLHRTNNFYDVCFRCQCYLQIGISLAIFHICKAPISAVESRIGQYDPQTIVIMSKSCWFNLKYGKKVIVEAWCFNIIHIFENDLFRDIIIPRLKLGVQSLYVTEKKQISSENSYYVVKSYC